MHGRGATDAFDGAVDRGYAESPGLVRVGLQERLVELDHVGAGREHVLDFLVQRDGAIHGDGGFVPVVLVEKLLRHRERARNRDLDGTVGIGTQEHHVPDLHRLPALDFADHPRHDLNLSCRARWDLRRVVDVHAVECGREAVGIAFAPDLAIAHDINARALLVLYRQDGGIVLSLLQVRGVDAPQLPCLSAGWDHLRQAPAIDQPIRLRVAAHQCCRQQFVGSDLGHADAIPEEVTNRCMVVWLREKAKGPANAPGGMYEALGCRCSVRNVGLC